MDLKLTLDAITVYDVVSRISTRQYKGGPLPRDIAGMLVNIAVDDLVREGRLPADIMYNLDLLVDVVVLRHPAVRRV